MSTLIRVVSITSLIITYPPLFFIQVCCSSACFEVIPFSLLGFMWYAFCPDQMTISTLLCALYGITPPFPKPAIHTTFAILHQGGGLYSIAMEKLCLSIGHDGVGIPAASGSPIAIALATSNACFGVGLKDRW